jgi:hypothetical protein
MEALVMLHEETLTRKMGIRYYCSMIERLVRVKLNDYDKYLACICSCLVIKILKLLVWLNLQ